MKYVYLPLLVFLSLILYANPNKEALFNSENYTYKEFHGGNLKLYLFKPDDWNKSQKRPAIVFYFGGGWNNRHITQFVAYAEYYASRGYVCFIPDYRVRASENVRAIDSVMDAQDAFTYVRENADEFGIDPNRIAASGGSAGGHLAASLGTLEDTRNGKLSEPNALILFNPVSIVDPFKNPTRFSFDRLGVKGYEISPYHHVDQTVPPTIIYHGTKDSIVPFRTAEIFNEKMLEYGNDSTLISFEGRDHGFFNHGKHLKESDYNKTLKYTDDFLTRIGWHSLTVMKK